MDQLTSPENDNQIRLHKVTIESSRLRHSYGRKRGGASDMVLCHCPV